MVLSLELKDEVTALEISLLLDTAHNGLNCDISTHVTRQCIATFSLTNEPPSRTAHSGGGQSGAQRSGMERSRTKQVGPVSDLYPRCVNLNGLDP